MKVWIVFEMDAMDCDAIVSIHDSEHKARAEAERIGLERWNAAREHYEEFQRRRNGKWVMTVPAGASVLSADPVSGVMTTTAGDIQGTWEPNPIKPYDAKPSDVTLDVREYEVS